jgi:hypothetical protein
VNLTFVRQAPTVSKTAKNIKSSTAKDSSPEVTVGSSISEGQRNYLMNTTKVSKLKFMQVLIDTLGFPKDSVSWNISQRAVHDIVRLN